MLNTQKTETYKWWTDKKMIGIIILIVSISLFLFSYMKIPFLTSAHKYTVGLLFGWYHPLFYIYIIYYSLILIFADKVKLPDWVRVTKFSYWWVVISIVFLSSQTGYFQSKGNWTELGSKSWHSVSDWWNSFKSSNNAWAPASTNGGLIAAFLYGIFAMITSGIGAFIISILMLVISVSLLISGTSIGLYKQMINKKKIDLERKEMQEDNNSEPIIEEDIEIVNSEPQDDPFPFDDPYK